MMVWLLGLLVVWILAGWALLWWGGRDRGRGLRRSLSTYWCTVGQQVDVRLTTPSPVLPGPPDPLDVVLLLDRSGSMGVAPGSPLQTMLRSGANFIRQLPSDSRVAVVGFDDRPSVHCTLDADRQQSLAAIRAVAPGGGTSIAAALDGVRQVIRNGRPGVRKIVLLCSDGQDGLDSVAQAAERLRAEGDVRILCIGIGDDVVDQVFLAAASAPEDYFHLRKTNDMVTLFQRLATEVNSLRGVHAVLREEVAAPRPFMLCGDTEPPAVQEDNGLAWFLSSGAPPPQASYTVEARCVGWQKLNSGNGRAEWSMPDGGNVSVDGPSSPRLLVLPRGFGWAWPILNPLAMILLARLWPCRPDRADHCRPSRPQLPPPLELPPLPPAPAERPWAPTPMPSLVVGLGESGDDIVSALKFRFADRLVDKTQVRLLRVALGRSPTRRQRPVLRRELDDDERIDLDIDLRPYLERLARTPEAPERAWVPLRRWLAQSRPANTSHGADDRAKARLAVLAAPNAIEQVLVEKLSGLDSTSAQVLLVGEADDCQTSGLIAEIAHICAGRGLSVCAVLATPSPDPSRQASVTGLAREMERFLTLRGEAINSERVGSAPATHLFDKCIVVGGIHDQESERRLKLIETVYSLVMDEAVRAAMPPLPEAGVHIADTRALVLPQDVLWQWVRARALRESVVERALGMRKDGRDLCAPPPTAAAIGGAVDRFWADASPSLTMGLAAWLRHPGTPRALGEAPGLGDAPTPLEQEVFCASERTAFGHRLHHWCNQELQDDGEGSRMGLNVLRYALRQIQDELAVVRTHLAGKSEPDVTETLAQALLSEFLTTLRRLEDDAKAWLEAFGGPELAGQGRICGGLAAQVIAWEDQARALLEVFSPPWAEIEAAYGGWHARLSPALARQLTVSVRVSAAGMPAGLELRGMDCQRVGDAIMQMLAQLDTYRPEIANWPHQNWHAAPLTIGPGEWLSTGRFARPLVPRAAYADAEGEGDPFRVAAIKVDKAPVAVALCASLPPGHSPAFVWTEEANAERIANRVRNQCQREPRVFSATMVNLLARPVAIVDFARECAAGHVRLRGGVVELSRGRQTAPLAEDRGERTFEDAIRRVVGGRDLHNAVLPPPSGDVPLLDGDALAERALDAFPCPLGVTETAWKDAITGAALECHASGMNG